MHRRSALHIWRVLAGFIAALVAVSLLTSCGQDGDTGGSSGKTIKVAVASNAVNYAPFWVALSEDLFKKHGVEVDVVNSNALAVAPSLLSSGEIDLLLTSAGQEVSVAGAGKPVNVIQAMFNYSPRGLAFVGGKDVKSMDQLRALGSNCKIATTQKGTAVYAYAKQVRRAYDLRCSLTELTTNPLEVAAMTSGRTDAGAFTPADASTVISKGGTALIDPTTMTNEEVTKIVPKPFPILTVAGLTPTLKAKSDAVERFLAGLQDGLSQVSKVTPEKVAAALSKTKYFPGIKEQDLAESLKPAMSSFPTGPDAGAISEDDWATTLESLQRDFGLPGFDAGDPKFSYKTVVDMGYLERSKNK